VPRTGTFVSFLPPFYREVKWTGTPAPLSAAPFTFEIVLPPTPPGDCIDSVQFCVRWEFTTADCHTCETTTCYTIRRGSLSPLPAQLPLPIQEVQ
jgi:hypothetical protein